MLMYKITLVLIIFISSPCLFIGCGKTEKVNHESKTDDDEKFIKFTKRPNQEAVLLLSQKYGLKMNSIENFLDHYLSLTDLGYAIMKESLSSTNNEQSSIDSKEFLNREKENYYQALIKASKASGIDVKTGTLIILEYKAIMIKRL